MGERKSHQPGVFSWVDLMTTDREAAKAFYGDLFGWTMVDTPMNYTMCQLDGKNVAGIGEQSEEMKGAQVSTAWSVYISHDDVDMVAERVAGAGGEVQVPPIDVGEEGRMAIFKDREGAVFGVWQPKNHIGAELVNVPGTFVWSELAARDTENAMEFYSKVFSWSTEEKDMDYAVYVMFKAHGRVMSGLLKMTEEWDGMPSHWMTYFAVADCHAAAKKAEELGGKICVPVTDFGIGEFAVIEDPQGGTFSIARYNEVAD